MSSLPAGKSSGWSNEGKSGSALPNASTDDSDMLRSRNLSLSIPPTISYSSWSPSASETFKSITKGNIDIDKYKDKKNNKKNEEKDKKKDENINKLIAYMKGHFGERVKDVKISTRLTDSPVCFVAEENAMDIHLENLLKKHKHLDQVTTKVLEINPDHKIIKNLSVLDFTNEKNKSKCAEVSDMLLNQAKIIEGIPLEDSKSFCQSINNLMVKDIS